MAKRRTIPKPKLAPAMALLARYLRLKRGTREYEGFREVVRSLLQPPLHGLFLDALEEMDQELAGKEIADVRPSWTFDPRTFVDVMKGLLKEAKGK